MKLMENSPRQSALLNTLRATMILMLMIFGSSSQAQVANDVATQNAILAALPAGVTAETATADQIAQAAVDVAFEVDPQTGEAPNLTQEQMEANLTQVMISLGELTREGKFKNAPRFGTQNPTERFYLKVLNVASSNLDVASTTYYGTTVQYIMGLTAAMREGQNFLNDAKSNAITRN